jgi:hypothetical protein
MRWMEAGGGVNQGGFHYQHYYLGERFRAPNEYIAKCNQKSGMQEMEGCWVDNLSSSEGGQVEESGLIVGGNSSLWQLLTRNKK